MSIMAAAGERQGTVCLDLCLWGRVGGVVQVGVSNVQGRVEPPRLLFG